jgi:cell division protein FtsZ
MMDQGKAMLGTGEATGERRAIEAAEAAINNPLLDDVSMKGAKGVIINITGGYDMTLFEADEACNRIRDEVDPEANIIFGSTFDESMDGVMRVSVIATGIDQTAKAKQRSANGFDFSKTPINRLHANKPANTQPLPTSYVEQPSSGSSNRQDHLAAKEEPEAELFEQRTYEVTTSEKKSQAETMRGTRYNDSFIPPAPVQVDKNEIEASSQPLYQPTPVPVLKAPVPVAPYRQENITTTPETGYRLRPPVPGSGLYEQPARRTSPTLLERITGLAHNVRHPSSSSSVTPEDTAFTQHQQKPAVTQQAPMQGSLAIDAPSVRPQPKDDSDLDIPAFLRRQAN